MINNTKGPAGKDQVPPARHSGEVFNDALQRFDSNPMMIVRGELRLHCRENDIGRRVPTHAGIGSPRTFWNVRRRQQIPSRVFTHQRFQQLPGIVGELLRHMQIPAKCVDSHAVSLPQPAEEFERTLRLIGLKGDTPNARVELIEEHCGRARECLAEAVDPIGNGACREWRRERCRTRTHLTGVENVDALGLALIENREVVSGQAGYRAVLPSNDHFYFDQTCADVECCSLRIRCLKRSLQRDGKEAGEGDPAKNQVDSSQNATNRGRTLS